MSALVQRGEVIDCSNPKLDLFTTVSGVKTNVFSLEFQIFDINVPAAPVQTFPLAGRESIDVDNDCPTGQRLSTGRYTALWTVDLAEPLTPHKISWFFRLTASVPEQFHEQPFDVVSVAASVDPLNVQQFRTRFPAYADQLQFPTDLLIEVLDEAIACVDPACFGPDFTVRAQNYLAAHLLAYSTDGARAKGATSVRAGSAGITFDAAHMNLQATGYGQRYLMLARKCTGGMVVC